nr:type II toxin-antitoxin system PemK/MazF family toxin [Candidatus Sigynarchaeum springense]MDO8119570.1 type II toxin-antitoxin system PemK/MazF family toxin [Candidatus Sigynarchaeota archaeon]
MTTTRHGEPFKSGDVVLVPVQFTDANEVKKRPGVVLFEEHDNIVIAGITSNVKMDGIPLTVKEGAIKDSVIKLNYIFTVSCVMIDRVLFSLTKEKRAMIHDALVKKLDALL